MASALDERRWFEYQAGAVLKSTGSTSQHKTGEWRSRRPVLEERECRECARCWVFCPDASIRLSNDGIYSVDYFHCKGCGICAEVCPVGAVTMVDENE